MTSLTPQQSKELDKQICESLGFQYGLVCQRCKTMKLGLREAADSFDEFAYTLCGACSQAGRRAGKGRQKLMPEPDKLAAKDSPIAKHKAKIDAMTNPIEVRTYADSLTLDPTLSKDAFNAVATYAIFRITELGL